MTVQWAALIERVRASRQAAAWRKVAPGVAAAGGIALAARLVAEVDRGLPDVLIALAGGIILRNALRAHWSEAGGKVVVRYLLRMAIALLGGGLTLSTVAARGVEALGLVTCLVVVAFGLGLALSRLGRLSTTMGILIGAGTAICGATAIVVISPLVRARNEETAYAIATIFTFNLIALVAYPMIGHGLHLSEPAFGTWAGTAVNDTSVVLATGFAYGPTAGAVATITKLIRTLWLLPLAVGLGLAFSPKEAGRGLAHNVPAAVPWFIVGFVGMAAMRSSTLLPMPVFEWTSAIASFLIVVVLAAVGLSVEFKSLFAQGLKPLGIGLALGVLMGISSLVAIKVTHLA